MAEAEKARRHAHAPYSDFHVGAALLLRDGRIVLGANVENASFGLSVCAERTAVWKAVTEGDRDFVAIAVTAGPRSPASPCGACRQVLHEFAPDLWVYWRAPGGRVVANRIETLLAAPFSLKESRRAARSRPSKAPKRARASSARARAKAR